MNRYFTNQPTLFRRLIVLVGIIAMWFSAKKTLAQTCTNCKEYIYVNEVDFAKNGRVHKFEVNAGTGALSEIFNGGGNPWYPGAGTSELFFPHGLGYDRNGFLYIGDNAFGPNKIRRLDCAGNIKPESEFVINQGPNNFLTNVQSYDGFIYSNGGNPRIYKYDPCTGAQIGYVDYDDGSDDWGFYIDQRTGTFYGTNPSGKIYRFNPTAADFINHTVYSPLIWLKTNQYSINGGADQNYPVAGYTYPNESLQGITTDLQGNIYVVQGNRDVIGTISRLLKFNSSGVLIGAGAIDNSRNGSGWNQMVGIVYSAQSNKLYTTSLSDNEDCVYRWNTDLTPSGVAVGPAPALQFAKGINILSECCPGSGTVDKSVCGAKVGDRISLSELLNCPGVVCEAQWTASPGSTGLTFNSCDLTITVNSLPACGTFTLSNVNLPNKKCAPYTITLNVSYLGTLTAPVISGNQTVCAGATPTQLSITTPATGTGVTYRWQRSTTSCTDGFTDIPGAMGTTYTPPAITQNTYYRVVASITGCTNGKCEAPSNCVTLIFQPFTITVTGSDVCEGATISLSASGGGTYSWAGPASFTATVASPTRAAATTAMAGVYSVTVTGTNSCTNSATTSVTVRPKPVINPTGSDVCEGATISLSASGGGSYAWSGPLAFTATVANPTRTNATTAMAGVYSVTVTGTNSCTNSATTSVKVSTQGASASNGGPVCVGQSITLSASAGGSTYSWSGPSGFSATVANPTRTGATTAMSGVYSVTVEGTNGCTGTATTSVIVNPVPVINPLGSDVCEGSSITLSATGGGSYAWSGPSAFSASTANPTRTNASIAMAGVYSVTVTGANSCTNSTTTSVTVRAKPVINPTGNDVCEGATILLSASGGGTYAWAGPSAFSASTANPTRTNATTAMAGVYSVTVTGTNSCSNTATTSVIVKSAPQIMVSSNSPVCLGEGSNISLTATGGTSYSWNGPSGFTSTEATLVRTNITSAMGGVYSVSATNSSSCTSSSTTSVLLNQQGAMATSNSPLCVGGTIAFQTNSGTSYSWAGPNNFSSTIQNPTRSNATTNMSGTYSITVQGNNNCSGSATVAVEIKPLPIISASTTSTSANPVCEGLNISLSATGESSYFWTGPNNFTATGASPVIQNASTLSIGIYSVTATGTNSCLATATVSVVVKKCYGSIGDYVWTDTNQNGLQDDTETGVANIKVILLTETSPGVFAEFANQLTNVNGAYLFDLLPSGNYKVTFVLPANKKFTSQNIGVNDAKDSDADPTTGMSQIVAIDAAGTGLAKDNPTIDAGIMTKLIDLTLDKSVDKKLAVVGDNITYTVKVKNEGEAIATGVTVTDFLNDGVAYISSSGSRGSFDINTHIWTIGEIGVGETVSLSISVRVLNEGVWFNTAQVCSANEEDIDSKPCNDKEDEDDIDHECFSVPYKLCKNEGVQITLPATLKNIKWFKNGNELASESSTTLKVFERGIYTYTASNSTCPTEGCCPIEVKEIDCCIPDRCTPFEVQKTKNK